MGCLTFFPAFLFGEPHVIPACIAAASFHFPATSITLDEKQVAGIAGAVYMDIAGLSADVAMGENVRTDALSQPVVKNEILAQELILDPHLPYLLHIIDDTPFQVEYIFESPVQHPGACFFAPDAPGAIHDDVPVLIV